MEERLLYGGRYAPIRHVGAGGAGDVYLVEDQRLGVQRALKLLFEPAVGPPDMEPAGAPTPPLDAGAPTVARPDEAQAERELSHTIRQRFLAEARLLARLQHPHLVPVYDVGTHGHRVFFVMEYATGGTLRDRMSGRPVPLRQVVAVVVQVLEGLEFVHARGIIHRDVKPENILRFERDRWRLGDFGVARFRDAHRDDLTRTGDYLGTLGYMAPEQRMDPRWVRPTSDLYAVGATLYTLLTRASRPPPDLYALELGERDHPDVPRPLLAVVRRATRLEPRERFHSAAEMRDELERAAAMVLG